MKNPVEVSLFCHQNPTRKRKVRIGGTKLVPQPIRFHYRYQASIRLARSYKQVRDAGVDLVYFSEFFIVKTHPVLRYLIQGSELAGLGDEALVANNPITQPRPNPTKKFTPPTVRRATLTSNENSHFAGIPSSHSILFTPSSHSISPHSFLSLDSPPPISLTRLLQLTPSACAFFYPIQAY